MATNVERRQSLKYAKAETVRHPAHPLIQGFPLEFALRHLANDVNASSTLRDTAKHVLTTGDTEGLWGLNDLVQEHENADGTTGHPILKAGYNFMSAADKVQLDKHVHTALHEEGERSRREERAGPNDESPTFTPEHHALRLSYDIDHGATDKRAKDAMKRVRSRVYSLSGEKDEKKVNESIQRHGYRAMLVHRSRANIDPEYDRERALQPVVKTETNSYGTIVRQGTDHTFNRENATRYRRRYARLTVRPGEPLMGGSDFMHEVHDEGGNRVGHIWVSPQQNGTHLHVNHVGLNGHTPNSAGLDVVRQVRAQLKAHYPTAKTIGGTRISGAVRANTGKDRPTSRPLSRRKVVVRYSADQHDVRSLLTQLSAPEHGSHMAGLDDPLSGMRGIAADALDEQGRGDEATLLRTPSTHVEVRSDGTVRPSFMERQAGNGPSAARVTLREQFVKPSYDGLKEPRRDDEHHGMTYWFAQYGHPGKVQQLPSGGYGYVSDKTQPQQWFWNPADGEGMDSEELQSDHPQYQHYPTTEELPDGHPLSPSELAYMRHHATTPQFRMSRREVRRYGQSSNYTHADFHRKIAENPKELTNHRVYADWLEEQGQPHAAEIIRRWAEKQHPNNVVFHRTAGNGSTVGAVPFTESNGRFKVGWWIPNNKVARHGLAKDHINLFQADMSDPTYYHQWYVSPIEHDDAKRLIRGLHAEGQNTQGDEKLATDPPPKKRGKKLSRKVVRFAKPLVSVKDVADTFFRPDGSPRLRAMTHQMIQSVMKDYNLPLRYAAKLFWRAMNFYKSADYTTPERYWETVGRMERGEDLLGRVVKYAKPNRSDFLDALRRMKSSNHTALTTAAVDVAGRMGMGDTKVLPALHDTPHGAVPGVAQAVYGQVRPESVHALAAWVNGLLPNGPGYAVFHPRPTGPDTLYRIRHEGSGMDLRVRLDRAGITSRVLVPHRKGFDILIPDKGNALSANVEAYSKQHGLSVEASPGHFQTVGSPDQGQARATMRNKVVQGERPTQQRRVGTVRRYSVHAPENGQLNPDQLTMATEAARTGDWTGWGVLGDHLQENGFPNAGSVMSSVARGDEGTSYDSYPRGPGEQPQEQHGDVRHSLVSGRHGPLRATTIRLGNRMHVFRQTVGKWSDSGGTPGRKSRVSSPKKYAEVPTKEGEEWIKDFKVPVSYDSPAGNVGVNHFAPRRNAHTGEWEWRTLEHLGYVRDHETAKEMFPNAMTEDEFFGQRKSDGYMAPKLTPEEVHLATDGREGTALKASEPNELHEDQHPDPSQRNTGGVSHPEDFYAMSRRRAVKYAKIPQSESGVLTPEQLAIATNAYENADHTGWGALGDHLAENGYPNAGNVLSRIGDRTPGTQYIAGGGPPREGMPIGGFRYAMLRDGADLVHRLVLRTDDSGASHVFTHRIRPEQQDRMSRRRRALTCR